MSALGIVETKGYLAAIEAADSALKAANVRLLRVERVKGGLVAVQIDGDVGSVNAAIESAKASLERLDGGKMLVGTHVIPRFRGSFPVPEKKEPELEPEPEQKPEPKPKPRKSRAKRR